MAGSERCSGASIRSVTSPAAAGVVAHLIEQHRLANAAQTHHQDAFGGV
jgi:hypothetical protein